MCLPGFAVHITLGPTFDISLAHLVQENTLLGTREPFDEHRRYMRRVMFRETFYPIALLTITFLAFLLTLSFASDKTIVRKAPLIATLSTAVSNGADLTVVRHIYRQRKTERSNIFKVLFNQSSGIARQSDNYSLDTPLSDILQDIRAEQFSGASGASSGLLPNLDKIIREHSQTNPFDKLELGQREAFDNIRAKLGPSYEQVQLDITRLSDELHAKNLAVEKYLRDSTFNLWLSVFALFISLAISAYQLYQGREKRITQLFGSVLKSAGETGGQSASGA